MEKVTESRPRVVILQTQSGIDFCVRPSLTKVLTDDQLGQCRLVTEQSAAVLAMSEDTALLVLGGCAPISALQDIVEVAKALNKKVRVIVYSSNPMLELVGINERILKEAGQDPLGRLTAEVHSVFRDATASSLC